MAANSGFQSLLRPLDDDFLPQSCHWTSLGPALQYKVIYVSDDGTCSRESGSKLRNKLYQSLKRFTEIYVHLSFQMCLGLNEYTCSFCHQSHSNGLKKLSVTHNPSQQKPGRVSVPARRLLECSKLFQFWSSLQTGSLPPPLPGLPLSLSAALLSVRSGGCTLQLAFGWDSRAPPFSMPARLRCSKLEIGEVLAYHGL